MACWNVWRVDDITVASSSPIATTKLLADLLSSFALRDLGPLNYFLGVQVTSSLGGGVVILSSDLLH